MNNSPNNQTKTPEQIIEEVMRERGKMVLAVADVSGDVKKTAMGVAVDAIEKWEENREKKGIDKVPIIGGIKGSVERSAQLNKYFKTAKQAIKETGSLSAAGLAIDEINKGTDLKAVNKRGEKVYLENIRDGLKTNGFDDTVARRLAVAKEEGEDSEDRNIALDEKYEQEDDLRKAFADYVRGSVDAYGKKNTAKRGKAKADAEDNLEAAIRALNEDKVVAGNYDEIKSDLNTMMDNLKSAGYLAKGKANEVKREEAFAAIDKYLADNLSVLGGKVETGLAAKEAYANLKDKAVLKYGVVVGVTAGVLGGAVSAITKNKIISNITNSSLVATGIRAGVAGVIGGVKGYRVEGNKQARENVKQALSGEEFEGDDKKYEIVSVEKKISAMDALLDGDKLKAGKYDEAAAIIAELRARNELQNKYHIQMLGFNGRKDVEASKYEMFKMIADLKKAMKAEKGDAVEDDIKKAYDFAMNGGKNDADEDVIGLLDKVSAVHRKQVGERWKAGVKSGLIAAGVAGAIDFAFHFNQNVDEIKALANGSKHFEGLNLVATEATGATGAMASEAINSGENQEAINEMKGKPVLIEEDEQGGVAVGIDANGNGKIDAGEYLRGEGEMKGIDLTNDKELAVLQGELHDKYEIDLNYETIKSAKYGEVEIGQYLEKAGNTVDQNIDNVDWGKSATKVVFGNPVSVSADGMDYYEVSVSGVNGGTIPEGAKFFIDLDGNGPGKALEFAIQDGKAIIPADIVDTGTTGVSGVAKFIGMARVGEFDGDKMISYATAFGKSAELGDKISAAMAEDVRAFTATSAVTGERLSQFAVNGDNAIISNMSEIFNGIEVGESERLPSVFKVNDIGDGQEDLRLASNEVIKDFDVEGGYHAEFDAFENTPFKVSDTYLGTPMTWDADGDGVLSAAEEASYVKQLLVRTGTNPYMLGQNASNYGILEPDRLESIIPTDVLKGWGITDGVVDSEEELNILMTALKERANADYWDKLANATINEMETQLMGGGFEVGTVTERLSTYANSQRMFDTANSSTTRTVLYPYKNIVDKDGNVLQREYVGNKGWWCRKYGAEGGKVGDLPLCEQKSIEKIATSKPTPKPTTTTPTTPTTPTEPVEPPSTPTTPVKPTVPTTPTEPEVPTTPTTPTEPVVPVTPTEPVSPEPGIIPKDAENLTRIDEQINEDIAKDIGTKEVVITPTESVSMEDLTPRPSGADFQPLTPTDIAPGDAAAQQVANEAAEQIIESGGIPKSVEDVADDYWAQFGY